jgi:hypothetical protein
MSYRVGPHTFTSKERLGKHASNLLQCGKINIPLAGKELEFVRALLDRHPRVKQKIGEGVSAISIRINNSWGTSENRCFWIKRTDGTETDFSYRECIWPTDFRSKFIRACRAAIAHQVIAFRHRMRQQLGEVSICPLSGREFVVAEAMVDHKHPDTFESIIDRFITEFDVDIAAIGISSGGDGQMIDKFIDPEFESSFVRFHAANAVFRLLPAKVNARLGNKAHLHPLTDGFEL